MTGPTTAKPPSPPPRRNREGGASPEWRARLTKVLRRTFGLRQLRDGQEAVIANVMAGKPTIAVMPTGAGKSLCYQMPAVLLPGTTIVVSPLIALMKDQRDKLRDLGIPAYEFNSAVPGSDIEAAEAAIAKPGAKIVFATPERLAGPDFLRLVGAQPVSLVVVDEAHCISQWGHDFRPAFLEIGAAVRQLGKPAILALTATASPEVVEDIARQIGVGPLAVVDTGVYRPNLHFEVVQVTNEADKLGRAVELVKATPGAGLVYAATVKAAEHLHSALVDAGVGAALYHGRLGASKRNEAQDAFMKGRMRVMVATNAFGLGIDKSDTRFVLHYQMPARLDAYYQEAGRAGRDGEVARCTLLFLHADKAVQQFFLAGRYPSREDLVALYGALQRGRDSGRRWTLDLLQQELARPGTKLQVALRLLRHQHVARQDESGAVSLTRAGLGEEALDRLLEEYRAKREADRAMLERMVFYGQAGWCRWKVLLDNFGEGSAFTACGNCDNCRRYLHGSDRSRAAEAGEAVPSEQGSTSVPMAPSALSVQPFEPGETVRVRRYGRGVVAAIDGSGVTVAFEGGSTRLFLPSFVQKVAPARASRSKAGGQAVPP